MYLHHKPKHWNINKWSEHWSCCYNQILEILQSWHLCGRPLVATAQRVNQAKQDQPTDFLTNPGGARQKGRSRSFPRAKLEHFPPKFLNGI